MPDPIKLWYTTRYRLAAWRRTHFYVCRCGHTRMAHVGACGACICRGFRRPNAWTRANNRLVAWTYGDQDRR